MCDIECLGNIIKVIGDVGFTPERFAQHGCNKQLLVNTKDVLRLFELVLRKMENGLGKEIIVEKDRCWKIENDSVYGFSDNALDLKPIQTSLHDNLQILRQIVIQNREIARSDFESLGDLFILILEPHSALLYG
ncbi:hypothetical protein KAU11_04770 [Candidatus Babeliales bacterium]|nr:hypothetical protein [Candidatus Babeliales bacterium]